jgi:hypothetical protein
MEELDHKKQLKNVLHELEGSLKILERSNQGIHSEINKFENEVAYQYSNVRDQLPANESNSFGELATKTFTVKFK